MKKRIISILMATAIAMPVYTVRAQNENIANDGISDIVVTANKREENLNKVGLSVTALSGNVLQERRITSLEDVAAAVPGLSYAPSETNTPIFTLRGIGFNESSLGVYPAVSVYLDQAPLPFPVLTSHSNYDLERIEVLKGPQGTLFGQNSTGGAINYIAARPTNDFQAGGDVSYGRFNRVEGNVYISGPLANGLKARVSATGLNEDGWQVSSTRPNDRNGKQSYVAGRLLLDYDAGDTFRLRFNVNGWRDTSEPQAPQFAALRASVPAHITAELLATPFASLNPRSADWSIGDETPRSNRKLLQTSLRADADVLDDVTLTSLTSYNRFNQELAVDRDGSALVISDLPLSHATIRSFNQELRIANGAGNSLRWLLGANLERSNTFENQITTYRDSSNHNADNLFISSSGVTNRQRITNYAGFANAEFDIASALTLKAGGRYTNSRIKDQICGYASGDGNVATLFNILGGLLGTVPFAPIGPNDCYTLNANGVPGTPFLSTLHEDNFSWKIGVDYKASADMLLYANLSRGYKAGSYPTVSAATFDQLQPVTQESVTTYEAGLKAGFFDRKAQFNAAVFYNDYKNKQIRGKLRDPIFDTLDALVNVPKSRIYGAEAELTVRPVPALTLSGAVTYLNSKIKRYSGYNVVGAIADFAGQDLPFTPTWTYAFNADYRPRLANGGSPFVGVTVNGRSSSDAALAGSSIIIPASPTNRVLPGLVHPFALKGYATVDFRAGYEADDGAWRIMLWAKNAFDKLYWTNTATSLDATFRYAGRPATYGLTVGFKMK